MALFSLVPYKSIYYSLFGLGASMAIQGGDIAGCLALEQAFSSLTRQDVDLAVVAGASISFKLAANNWLLQHGLGKGVWS